MDVCLYFVIYVYVCICSCHKHTNTYVHITLVLISHVECLWVPNIAMTSVSSILPYFINSNATATTLYRHCGTLVISTTDHHRQRGCTDHDRHLYLPRSVHEITRIWNNNFVQGLAMNTENYVDSTIHSASYSRH